MRKITLEYVGVLNETQHLFIFSTVFDKKELGLDVILNLALPALVQDIQIRKIITKLEKLTRKDVQKMS